MDLWTKKSVRLVYRGELDYRQNPHALYIVTRVRTLHILIRKVRSILEFDHTVGHLTIRFAVSLLNDFVSPISNKLVNFSTEYENIMH